LFRKIQPENKRKNRAGNKRSVRKEGSFCLDIGSPKKWFVSVYAKGRKNRSTKLPQNTEDFC